MILQQFKVTTQAAGLFLAGLAIATPFVSSIEAAQVPNEIIYEGRMLSKAGTVLSESYVLRFSFWKNGDYISTDVNVSGEINSSSENYAGWVEVLPISFNDLGHFSVVLGKSSSLENLNIDSYKYLQVEIKKASDPDSAYQLLDIDGDGGVNTTDRKFIASVPYARHSEVSEGSEGSTFVIDSENIIEDAGTGNISLQFGGNLQEYLHYNVENDRFVLTGDLELQTDLITSGLVDGVDVSELANAVAQNSSDILANAAAIAQNAGDITAAQAAITQNAADILSTATALTAVQVEIIKNATDILTNANAITAAQAEIINNTTTISQNSQNLEEIKTELETITVTASGGEIAAEKIVIDSDDTGGNITLQFGGTLNETLMWNAASEQFELSDDILVNGNIELTGTVDGVDISDLSNTVDGNVTNIAGNTSIIAENVANITQAQQDILQNAADILNNKTNISNVDSRLTTAEETIVQNAADILGNTTAIANNSSHISENSSDIDALESTVAAHSLSLTQAQADIIQNAANILSNTNTLTSAQQDIVNNAAKISQNAADIITLKNEMSDVKGDILQNAADILTNKSTLSDLGSRLTTAEEAIVQNAADILGNAAVIAQNKNNIIDLQSDVNDLNADVLSNTSDILDNSSKILANKNAITQAEADIVNNAANILSNKTNISRVQQEVLDLAVKITQNAANISDNSGKIDSLKSDISDIGTIIGNGDFTGAQYISFGDTLTQGIIKLDKQIQLNTQGISTNANNIAGNTSTISDNVTGIAKLNDAVGDFNYSSENIVSNGEDITTSIGKLDAYIGSSEGVFHQVNLGTASLHADGTDNKINIYQSLEKIGTNDKHFYKIISQQASLQDMDIQFKVLLPNNFDEFKGFSISYKTEGAVTDSALDIEVRDANGNIAASQSALSSGIWTSFAPNINAAFNPQLGEYIYITLKPYTKDKNAVRVGDIVLKYTTHR